MAKEEDHILKSWQCNALAWNEAIEGQAIESRKLVTDKAIVEAITGFAPVTVLDVGCGEGWLCRALNEKGITATGVDAVPALIEKASEKGKGKYMVCTYQQIAEGHFMPGEAYNAIVFNFSLFGKELTESVLKKLSLFFSASGRLVIQTLHPCTVNREQSYKDGWREGSWTGFSEKFTDPAPWYFRTIGGWVTLFLSTGYFLQQIIEPLNPLTGKPASIIFVCGLQKA